MKKFFRMLGLIILIGNIGFAEYTIKDGKAYCEICTWGSQSVQ